MANNKKYKKERNSYGIACFRINKGQLEILLIRKRVTYAFNAFISGNYNAHNNNEIIQLLSGMEYEEKVSILSLDFKQLWYRLWPNKNTKVSYFIVARTKFESNFVADGGVRLKNLISQSTNSNYIWEIPKGQKTKYETPIECAVRELLEETGLCKSDYTIYLDSRKYSYIDNKIKYTNTFYIAHSNINYTPSLTISNTHQVIEISNIKWVPMSALREYIIHNSAINNIMNMAKYVLKKISIKYDKLLMASNSLMAAGIPRELLY